MDGWKELEVLCEQQDEELWESTLTNDFKAVLKQVQAEWDELTALCEKQDEELRRMAWN